MVVLCFSARSICPSVQIVGGCGGISEVPKISSATQRGLLDLPGLRPLGYSGFAEFISIQHTD